LEADGAIGVATIASTVTAAGTNAAGTNVDGPAPAATLTKPRFGLAWRIRGPADHPSVGPLALDRFATAQIRSLWLPSPLSGRPRTPGGGHWLLFSLTRHELRGAWAEKGRLQQQSAGNGIAPAVCTQWATERGGAPRVPRRTDVSQMEVPDGKEPRARTAAAPSQAAPGCGARHLPGCYLRILCRDGATRFATICRRPSRFSLAGRGGSLLRSGGAFLTSSDIANFLGSPTFASASPTPGT
jgi:hypothetical protein